MATAVTSNSHLQHIQTARTQLHACFRRAHEFLTSVESKLLRELESIQDDCEVGFDSFTDLQSMESNQSLVNKSLYIDLLYQGLAEINRKMEEIFALPPLIGQTIRFQWNYFDTDLQHAGEVITHTLSQPTSLSSVISQPIIPAIPDYKNKSMPVITANGELNLPSGLAIEPQSGSIYIADAGNNKVQVFSLNGEGYFKFSRNMHGPYGICINKDTVYVSQLWGHCITLYKLDGTYINNVGSKGTMKGQFNFPTGIDVSPTTGHLYVCDRNNHRVQVFDNELKFHSLFALVKDLYYPSDVKFNQHLVLVLDRKDPCLHLFNITDQSLLRSIISRGLSKQITETKFFTIDRELNILLTDFDKHCVCVFSQSGELIAQFGKEGHFAGEFYYPSGIAIDNQNRIVIVSQSEYNVLQLF